MLPRMSPFWLRLIAVIGSPILILIWLTNLTYYYIVHYLLIINDLVNSSVILQNINQYRYNEPNNKEPNQVVVHFHDHFMSHVVLDQTAQSQIPIRLSNIDVVAPKSRMHNHHLNF